MGLVARALQFDIQQTLHRLPLFAYLGRRGTEDAIHRVALHCSDVRGKLKSTEYPVHRMKQGEHMPALIGGLSLSLDLTRAFDTVDRAKLFQGLTMLGVNSNLVLLIQKIYQQTSYEFEHRGVFRRFMTYKGIRQGCMAAPCLWSAFAALLLLQATEALTWTFVLNFITTFADDFLHSTFYFSF